MTRKKTWIFLRGLGRNQGHWGPFLNEFKDQFPNDHIELLDLAGSGTEAHRQSPWKISSYVEDLRSRRQSQGPISLVSISMGAMVATEWARLHPNEVESLILINTNGKGLAPFYRRLQFKNYPQMIDMLIHFKDRKRFESGVLEMTAQGLKDRPGTLERHLNLPPTSAKNWLRQLAASAQFQFPAQAPVSKILILSAIDDRLVSSQCSEKLALTWSTPHMQHPKGAHDLPLIESSWIIQKIKEFQ